MGLAGSNSMRRPSRARSAVVGCAALAAVAIVFSSFTASSLAGSRNFFGIAAGAQSMDGKDFRKMHSAGARSFRFAFNWAGIQPRQGTHVWTRTDHIVGSAAAHGIRTLPIVITSPGWVTKKPSQPPVGSKSKVRAWKAFLADAARRYGPGGSYWQNEFRHSHPGKKPKPVTAWQIWNEPNLKKFFAAKHRVKAYASLVKSANKAIGNVDRHAKIVLAGMPATSKPRAWTFLGKLYNRKHFKKSFDAAALHPYASTIHQYRKDIKKMRHVMKRHHDRRAGLWLTEVGWGSARHQRVRPLNKGKRGQKRMLKKSFRLTLHHRKRWHIQSLYWFDFRDPPKGTGGCTFCDSAGLLKHSRKPKPAFKAFKHIAR